MLEVAAQKKKGSPEKGWLEPGIRVQVAALSRWPRKPHKVRFKKRLGEQIIWRRV